MAKQISSRNAALENFFETLDKKIADKKPATLFIAIIENLQMLHVAYGHLRSDKIISELCGKISAEIGDTWRVADNIIAVVNDVETPLKTVQEIKKIVSQFGARGSEAAAHISSRVDFTEIRNTEKTAEQVFQDLFIMTSFNNRLHERQHHCEQQKSRTQMALANQVYDAIDNKRLHLAFQPIIEAKTGRISHHECLLRIIDANGKSESAGSFIDIAEKMGIIENIDLYVLDMVLDKLESEKDIHLALNISNITIGHPEWSKKFFERVTPDIAKRLTVEITETAAMLDLPGTAYFIATLQETGCSIALDDFGSGHTSFRQVRGLSLDYVKIDGSLIKDITKNQHNQLLVKSLIEFLKGLNVKTIAEFVDGGDTAKFLIASGIDYMQGNYFGAATSELSS